MKVKVGNTFTEIEIGQYHEVNKGALKAFFSIVEYPTGRKTLDCRYFVKDDQIWFSFPQKEIKKPGIEKPDYMPLISYMDKEYLKQFQKAVLEALKHQETNGQTSSYQKQTNILQDNASSIWFG